VRGFGAVDGPIFGLLPDGFDLSASQLGGVFALQEVSHVRAYDFLAGLRFTKRQGKCSTLNECISTRDEEEYATIVTIEPGFIVV